MNLPEISVVMATRDASAVVEPSLRSLAEQAGAAEVEIVVADSSDDSTRALVRSAFPQVRLLECRRDATLPQQLLAALRAARGRIIVVTEPCCRFPAGWLQELRRAHESTFAVIGGAVAYAGSNSLASWACYFADYSAFPAASPKQETPVLPGNHVSYKREILSRAYDSMPDGFRKTFFHGELEKQGARFLFDPDLVAYWEGCDSFGAYARRFFQNGRDFAATRSKHISYAERVVRMLTAPLLPPLVLYRRLRPAFNQRDCVGRLLLSLPLIVAFMVVWSAGEFLGYWNGPARSPQAEANLA